MKIENDVKILNLDDILPNRFQPRITFNEQAILELADSIKEHGVIQPIIVRKIADKFEIIAGERRYKASVLAGKTNIPAIVVDLNDKDSAEIALIENVQRQGLTPIEEAVSYKKILDMGYLNQSDLAKKLGKNQSTIANKLRLLNLSDEVQDALLKERISERHARSLLRLDKEKQNVMLNRIITERLTVRKTDEEIRKMLEQSDDDNGEEKQLNPIKKEGNENMNQNDVNNVNVPSEPVQENTINPGFMDVNKIESQARDINSVSMTPETPAVEQANASIFTAPSPVEVTPTPVTTPEPVSNSIPQPDVVTPQSSFDTPQTPQMAVPPVMPTEQPMPQPDFNPMESELVSGGKFFNIPVDNGNDVNNNMNTQPVNNTFGIPTQPIMGQENVAMPETNQVNPVASMFAANQNQAVESIPTTPDMTKINSNLSAPVNNEPIITQNPAMTNPSPMNSFGMNQTQNMGNFNPNQSLVEIGGNGVATEEPVLQPVMQTVVQPKKADLKEAIMLIRNCADKIESMGFTIDVEELDFENSYQVSFKINKD